MADDPLYVTKDPYPKPPIRRRTAYAYFVSEYCRKYRRLPDPRKMHYLSDEEKVRYQDLEKKDAERYKKEFEEWKKNFKGKRIPPIHRKRKNPRMPKQTRNAYLHYFQNQLPILRRDNPNLPYQEVTKMIGLSWKNLSDQEKHPFIMQEANDKERYRREKLQARKERAERFYENALTR